MPQVPILLERSEKLTQGNSYPTTLGVINGALVKLSMLTRCEKLYRAPGGALPPEFWAKGKTNVSGGVEMGFLSATTSKGVALGYASRSTAGVLFEATRSALSPHTVHRHSVRC